MQKQGTLEQCLVDEVRRLRQEAESLPLGDLRNAVEEIAQHAEKQLLQLRDDGTIEWPAFLRSRILV